MHSPWARKKREHAHTRRQEVPVQDMEAQPEAPGGTVCEEIDQLDVMAGGAAEADRPAGALKTVSCCE